MGGSVLSPNWQEERFVEVIDPNVNEIFEMFATQFPSKVPVNEPETEEPG